MLCYSIILYCVILYTHIQALRMISQSVYINSLQFRELLGVFRHEVERQEVLVYMTLYNDLVVYIYIYIML